eukprot:Rhum_TRINITY_DN17000_c0_g1::Rhum_TRINITY_DN17000_c0_g1_i1::g.165022::m.165022
MELGPGSGAAAPPPAVSTAQDFLRSLKTGCGWAVPLSEGSAGATHVPPPPTSFLRYVGACKESLGRGSLPVTHVESHYVDTIVEVDENTRRAVSGGSCLRFRHPEVADFFAGLFSYIAGREAIECGGVTTRVQLAPWDLSHGHLVMHEAPDGGFELAIVFHAKEFPKEYRHTSTSPVLPIGHELMGGAQDPRTGTQVSVADVDYHLRNYVYLLSSNTVYLLDVAAEQFPQAFVLKKGCEFCTFPEWRLGRVVGDVNYLTKEGVLVAPRGALHLPLRVANEVDRLHAAAGGGDVKNRFLEVHADIASPLQTIFQGTTLAELACLAAMLDRHAEHDDEGVAARVEEARTESEHHYYRWYFTSRLPRHSLPALRSVLRDVRARKHSGAAENRAKQLDDLLQRGITEAHAEEALAATASEGSGGVSAFRALQALEVVYPQYRSEANTAAYGCAPHDMDTALAVCKEVFYADSALEAIALHAANPERPLVAVCKELVRRKDTELRAKISADQAATTSERSKI